MYKFCINGVKSEEVDGTGWEPEVLLLLLHGNIYTSPVNKYSLKYFKITTMAQCLHHFMPNSGQLLVAMPSPNYPAARFSSGSFSQSLRHELFRSALKM